MKKIFTRIAQEMEAKNDTVLVVISKVAGSAPRGDGALMLVGREGLLAGTIGGGLAERIAIDMAMELVEKKESVNHPFDLNKDREGSIDAICGGEIEVHMQFIGHDDETWKTVCEEVITNIENRIPKTLVINLDGSAGCVTDEVTKGNMLVGEQFKMALPLGERAFIFGAGHCSKALVPILSSVGFRVTVMDNRPEEMKKEFFPEAETLIVNEYENVLDVTDVGPEDYVVIMTAGHSADYLVEEKMLRKETAYLGCIGSRSKLGIVRDRLRKDGFSEEKIMSVHAPIGISIHSVTPAEVAVSIAAEMISERHNNRIKAGFAGEKICPV